MAGRRIGLGIAAAAALALAAPASAAPVVRSYEAGPFDLSNYKVALSITGLVPKPDVDWFITKMKTDVVDAATHKLVPIQRVMLHHIVFANLFALGE